MRDNLIFETERRYLLEMNKSFMDIAVKIHRISNLQDNNKEVSECMI